MNPSDSPESAMPAVNPITRRDFMKKTALTAGAITLLGQGIGFAAESGTSSTQLFKKEIEWRIILTGHPLKQDGTLKTAGSITVDVNDEGNNAPVGELTMDVESVTHPDDSKYVLPAERATGIPESKLLYQASFQQRGKLKVDISKLDIFHINDSVLPDSNSNGGWALTPVVTEELQYYVKSITWSEGQAQPADPVSPDFKDNPDADSAKNVTPFSTHLALVGEWSDYGWTWVGILKDESNVTLTITHIGQWAPKGMEAKTGNLPLIWGLQKARHERTLHRKANEPNWTPMVSSDTDANGWTKWLPE